MSDKIETSLRDGRWCGTKIVVTKAKSRGTTAIKACFTHGGRTPETPPVKEVLQYCIAVNGETMRFVAPLEDLEIIEAENCRLPT